MSELKPCPFCGGEAEVYKYTAIGMEPYFVIMCRCGARIDKSSDGEKAVEAWNTRHERTCHVEGFYYDDLMDEDYTDLSCGHHLRGAPREFDFCPTCGARVKEDTDAD